MRSVSQSQGEFTLVYLFLIPSGWWYVGWMELSHVLSSYYVAEINSGRRLVVMAGGRKRADEHAFQTRERLTRSERTLNGI